ncbi:CBP80/20-dependent translation initiation factor-like [Scleropages formosus]|uniref:CBP80/20-dependent translation initiation factor-like n=1 Tax=Scleropages formosus TaxID=113540 RepID=A0A0P7VDS3_SCLFO|nr:CBP80/20-dependent translation initiation factor-like [Scleropages formosus]
MQVSGAGTRDLEGRNRRWHHNQKHQGGAEEKPTPRNAKDTESGKTEEPAPGRAEPESDRGHGSGSSRVPSTEDKHRAIHADGPKDEFPVATTNPQRNRMDKLLEILNSMRNNSSDVDSQLTTFMEEAQNSTSSEEMLSEIVRTIYHKAVSDRSFASTAAKLCDKMALFIVEGTKFRSLLLNMLQLLTYDEGSAEPFAWTKDFTRREELQQTDVERWLGFITFLCEVFGIMRSSAGEPFRVLVCPIYTCLREVRDATRPHIPRFLHASFSMPLLSIGSPADCPYSPVLT